MEVSREGHVATVTSFPWWADGLNGQEEIRRGRIGLFLTAAANFTLFRGEEGVASSSNQCLAAQRKADRISLHDIIAWFGSTVRR